MQSILIVDDEKSIRESLTGILQDEGFTPASVDSALEIDDGIKPARKQYYEPQTLLLKVGRAILEGFPHFDFDNLGRIII